MTAPIVCIFVSPRSWTSAPDSRTRVPPLERPTAVVFTYCRPREIDDTDPRDRLAPDEAPRVTLSIVIYPLLIITCRFAPVCKHGLLRSTPERPRGGRSCTSLPAYPFADPPIRHERSLANSFPCFHLGCLLGSFVSLLVILHALSHHPALNPLNNYTISSCSSLVSPPLTRPAWGA